MFSLIPWDRQAGFPFQQLLEAGEIAAQFFMFISGVQLQLAKMSSN